MGQNTEDEARATSFDSTKVPETIPLQDMEINHTTNEVRCSVNCPHWSCSERVTVPFQRIVICPSCKGVFKVSMT